MKIKGALNWPDSAGSSKANFQSHRMISAFRSCQFGTCLRTNSVSSITAPILEGFPWFSVKWSYMDISIFNVMLVLYTLFM